MTLQTERYTFRATLEDVAHITEIAGALRCAGLTFATRSDAIRACLAVVAAEIAARGIPTDLLEAAK